MLLRLAYLGVTNAFAMLRLLPMSDREKDVEILALRHQIAVLERQLNGQQVRFHAIDRAFLASLLHGLPRHVLRQMRLLVRPDTVLRWPRNLIARRHAAQSKPKHGGRPRTVHSIRALVLRLARENPSWGYRRLHGELLVLGVKVVASTVWEILKDAGIDPAPERASSTWAAFLHSQADALLACDFFETITLSGARLYVFAAIEHANRRIRILSATAHPTASWVVQAAKLDHGAVGADLQQNPCLQASGCPMVTPPAMSPVGSVSNLGGGGSVKMPRWWRSRHRPTRQSIVAVTESLELPASAESIAAAIDSARGLTDEPGSAGTSVRVVRDVLRQLSAEGWATRMSANQWYGRGVYVRAASDGTDLWWPTHKWHRVRDAHRHQPSTKSTTQTAGTSGTSTAGRGKRAQERSEVAKAVDRVIEANRAHYEAHKNDVGPGAN